MATRERSRLASRKLWITIGSGILFGIVKLAGAPVPDEIIKVVLTYIAGQSAVDIAEAIGKAKSK